MARAQSLQQQGQTEAAGRAALAAQNGLYRAREHFMAAEADRSRDTGVVVEFAEFSERMQDYDLAGEAFARAAALDGGRADLWHRAARNFIAAGGRYLERATPALDAAAKANGESTHAVGPADIAAARGDLMMARGLPDDAAPHYAEALAADAQHVRARIGAAGAALQLGDVERASDLADGLGAPGPAEGELLDRVLRESYLVFRRDRVVVPETAAAQRALAKLCVRLGFLEEGHLAIERAVQLDDGDVFSWNLLGSLSREAGDTARAREAFTRSLQLAPDQPRTKQALDELGAQQN
jgi:tetratricopeptide (TPR) repeat protein